MGYYIVRLRNTDHMIFLHNILSVARFESKLLVRSWFFKVFAVISVLVAFGYSMGTLSDAGDAAWLLRGIPSTIPYGTLLLLNMAQAVIAIFLSSEFIKRDKQLDTSEVFYVRPLSNAEYVFGKTWGNLKVFFLLNILILAIALIFNATATGSHVDWSSYAIYFVLITVPTLIFIMGLSFCVMLLLNNQALTFVIMLGYVGLTLFYIGDKVYYLFDYMAFNLPMFRSTVVGFSDIHVILIHRGIYLFAGIGFIFLTIFLFKRLPHAPRMRYIWLIAACISLLGSACLGYTHVNRFRLDNQRRQEMITLDNQFGSKPVLAALSYKLDVKQRADGIEVLAEINARAVDTSQVFVYCLNPSLEVTSVTSSSDSVSFQRFGQILLLDFGRQVFRGEELTFTISYSGTIDELLCFLDIPDKNLRGKNQNNMVNFAKKYAFVSPEYLLLTPESYWYPRAGTAFSTVHTGWQQPFFCKFDVTVSPLPGMIPVAQGQIDSLDGGRYRFRPETSLPSLSLSIGNYDLLTTTVDSVRYSVYYFKGHDFFTKGLDSIKSEIPNLINERRLGLARDLQLTYPFKRVTLVEVPGQFTAYDRTWTQAWEWTQPEIIFIPEMAYSMRQAEFTQSIKRRRRFNSEQPSEQDQQRNALNDFLWTFQRKEGRNNRQTSGGVTTIVTSRNPWYQFPQFYDFTFNIFSSRWPVANRLVASYIQNSNAGVNQFQRTMNGMSPDEQASVLLQEKPLSELIVDTTYRDMINGVVSLKAQQLFAQGEYAVGEEPFRSVFSNIVKSKPFQNVRFENFLKEVQDSTGVDILSKIDAWYIRTKVPRYLIGIPKYTRVRNWQTTQFEVVEQISNKSDVEGIVKVSLQYGGGNANAETYVVQMLPGQTKEIVMVSESQPRSLVIRTMVSQNLPGYIEHIFSQMDREQRKVRDPGQYILEPSAIIGSQGEIIVDNEDDALFEVSKPDMTGLLQNWLQQADDKKQKYSGYSPWRAPIKWTLVTNSGYYGQYVRSAHIIRAGNGSQTATWKVPLKEKGRYDIYYYAFIESQQGRGGQNRGNQGGPQGRRGDRSEYNLRVRQGKLLNEEATIEFWSNAGWVKVGTYILEADTAFVDLTNKAPGRLVAADAVRFVKR